MADLALAAIMAVWGSSFSILRILLGGAGTQAAGSPLALVAVRMTLASALLLAFLALRRHAHIVLGECGPWQLGIEHHGRSAPERRHPTAAWRITLVPIFQGKTDPQPRRMEGEQADDERLDSMETAQRSAKSDNHRDDDRRNDDDDGLGECRAGAGTLR